jgi:hypothetical protein
MWESKEKLKTPSLSISIGFIIDERDLFFEIGAFALSGELRRWKN